MCVGKPDSPAPVEAEKPVFVHNPYLDEKSSSNRDGTRADRASLLIPLLQGIGFTGRGGTASATAGGPASTSRTKLGAELAIRPTPQGVAPGPAPIPIADRLPTRPTPTGDSGQYTRDDIIEYAIRTRNRDGSPKDPP